VVKICFVCSIFGIALIEIFMVLSFVLPPTLNGNVNRIYVANMVFSMLGMVFFAVIGGYSSTKVFIHLQTSQSVSKGRALAITTRMFILVFAMVAGDLSLLPFFLRFAPFKIIPFPQEFFSVWGFYADGIVCQLCFLLLSVAKIMSFKKHPDSASIGEEPKFQKMAPSRSRSQILALP